jgi:tRNA modification GTPase
MTQNETIVASATPEGLGALSVIRVSGNNAFSILKKCLVEKEKFIKEKPRYIQIYTFIDSKSEPIDEITAIKYQAPKSFTGEEMVEIICHGGEYTPIEIIRTIVKNGAKYAEKGEFTKRAFINGKLDLMKAESIKAIIESTNETENKIARNAYQGKYLAKIQRIKECLINILSGIEAEIEFVDEDDVKSKNDNEISVLINEMENELKRRNKVKEIENGNRVIIAGPANAGKSTLFNKILGYERSIIDEEPGTTRDIISERINLNGKTATLSDTAGIRETKSKIELLGINKSKKILDDSTAIIWVSSSNEPLYNDEIEIVSKNKNRIIGFINKTDIKRNPEKEEFFKKNNIKWMNISLIQDAKINEIAKAISDLIKKQTIDLELPEIVIGDRQEEIIKEIKRELSNAKEEWKSKEIAAYYLNKALKKTESLLGKNESEEIVNRIFQKFCIGK